MTWLYWKSRGSLLLMLMMLMHAAVNNTTQIVPAGAASHDSLPCLAVEFLKGETLRSRLTSLLPLSTVLGYAVQIGRGVAAAHHRGIIHCDLKPDIFVTRGGQIKLLDFGFATEPDRGKTT